MAFFEKFPFIAYDINGTKPNKFRLVTNIFSRVKMLDSIKNETLVYYTYSIQEGDTPEIIASKYYDNPSKHWIILLANDIIDPVYDWPLSYQNFLNFIKDKYGSIQNAQTTVHHYEKIITKTDSITSTVTIEKHEIDANTYANTASSYEVFNLQSGNTVKVDITKKAVDCYEYEHDLNESKRQIRIIDKRYADQIENELVGLITNNA